MAATLLASAQGLSAAEWRRLDTADDPFVSQAFLAAAEQTGAAGSDFGWQPMHLALRDDQGELAALLPLYLRSHSFGDFAHDWSWAPAWRQAGLEYYPKLVTGVPYTPSPGPRLLTAHGDEAWKLALVSAAIDLVKETGASSWQCLFVQEGDRSVLETCGLLFRRGVQFHWRNHGYRDFTDFVATFTADKRKKLKRERRAVAEAGLRIDTLHGDEIIDALWPTIHRHYRDTFQRYGNHPAFSEAFFRRVAAALGKRMVVFVAWEGDRPVASSICYRNETTLFGRHWGTDIDCPGLHFELCYYQGIEYCIAQGLNRFEPGAQGEHKLARGFEPVPTWSAFWIADEQMRGLVARYLAREADAMLDYQGEMTQHLPFKAA